MVDGSMSRNFLLLTVLIGIILGLVNSARPTEQQLPAGKPLIPLARALDGVDTRASRPTVPRNGGTATTTTSPPPPEITGCRRRVSQCVHLSNATCLGAALPYSDVSLDLAGMKREYEAVSALREWGVLRAAPECWRAVRSMLCSVFLAPCRAVPWEDGDIFEADLIPRSSCLAARRPCRIVEEQLGGWPEYLRCDNNKVFADRTWDGTAPCGVVAMAAAAANNRSITPATKSNYTRGRCLAPLVPTEREAAYFGSFGGCGMRCLAPPYNGADYDSARRWSTVWSACVFAAALLVFSAHLWSKMPDRKSWNVSLGNIYLCWVLFAVAFLMRGLVGDSLVCHEDGARQVDAGSWCQFNFFLAYVSFIAFLVSFLCLCYYWMVFFRGTSKETSNSSLFLFLPWAAGLLAAISCSTFGLVEADTLAGVCFVTYDNPTWARPLAVLAPVVVAVAASVLMCFKMCVAIRASLKKAKQQEEKDKLRSMRLKAVAFVAVFAVGGVIFTIVEAINLLNRRGQKQMLVEYVVCRAKQAAYPEDYVAECNLDERGGTTALNLLFLFLTLLALMSFVFIWGAWNEKIRRTEWYSKAKSGCYKYENHELVKLAYAQRKNLIDEDGSITINLKGRKGFLTKLLLKLFSDGGGHAAAHEYELDSEFAENLPRMIQRRNGLGEDELGPSVRAYLDLREKGRTQQDSVSLASFNSSASRISKYSVLLSEEMEDLRNRYGGEDTAKKSKRYFPYSRRRRRRRSLTIRRNNDEDSFASDADTVSGASVALHQRAPSESDLSLFDGAMELQRIVPGVQQVKDKLAAMSPESSVVANADKSPHNSISVQTSLTDLPAAAARSCDAATQCQEGETRHRQHHVEVEAVITRTDDASSSNTSGSELRGLNLNGVNGLCSAAWRGVGHQHNNAARRGGIVDLRGMDAGLAMSAMSTRPLVDSSSTS